MAAGANGDQQIGFIDAGLAVMDMQSAGGPAGAAAETVALQNLVAQAGKALAGVGGGAGAGAAEAGDGGQPPAAGAEEVSLRRKQQRGLYSRLLSIRAIIIGYFLGW